MLLHNKSAGNHFPTLSGLTFWGHYKSCGRFDMQENHISDEMKDALFMISRPYFFDVRGKIVG